MFSKLFRRKPPFYAGMSTAAARQDEGGETDRLQAPGSRYEAGASASIRFRVRPGYHSIDLLVEVLDDHRRDGFPWIGSILSDALRSEKRSHPNHMDRPEIGLRTDHRISHWSYPGGAYEIDDDIWGLFVHAVGNNEAVIGDIERALLATGQFAKVDVDFEQFR